MATSFGALLLVSSLGKLFLGDTVFVGALVLLVVCVLQKRYYPENISGKHRWLLGRGLKVRPT